MAKTRVLVDGVPGCACGKVATRRWEGKDVCASCHRAAIKAVLPGIFKRLEEDLQRPEVQALFTEDAAGKGEVH